jgi:hypothetical protein
MRENRVPPKKLLSELQARIKEYMSKYEKLRGFL